MKKEVLKKAFEYLRSQGSVHTQKELAEKVGYSQPTVSRAFFGDSRYLTEGFLVNLNRAFGGIFRHEWLLTGEGEMLAQQPQTASISSRNVSMEEVQHRQAETRLWELIHDFQANNRRLMEENDRLRAEIDMLRVKLGEKGKSEAV